MPTGTTDPAASLVRGAARGASARSAASSRRRSFGGTSKREMRLELMGEDTPGPGAYLPTSTFARASASSSSMSANAKGKKPAVTTSSFRSTSAQRLALHNIRVPGPGAHSPNKAAVEKNATNPSMHLISRGNRFAPFGSGSARGRGRPEPGPGTYETQRFCTMATDMAHAVAMGSRQNPGFGIASQQHQLPHEQAVSNDAELPGPGKYETNNSLLSKADGHSSVFKPPMERKKGRTVEPQEMRGGKARGSSSQRSKKEASRRNKSDTSNSAETVHV